VLSFKDAGTTEDHARHQGRDTFVTWKPPELRGVRFSADAPLPLIVEFACHPLVTPYRQETPDWMRFEYYKIDALAPAGTDLDGARAMLRAALAKRMALQYHVADRQTQIYYLARGSGPVKLTPSTGPDPPGGSRQSTWVFRYKASDLPSFAKFLSSVVRYDVIDRTGIQGSYQFDVDWSSRLQEMHEDMQSAGIRVADDGLRQFGLKLEPGKEVRKILVVDRANKVPTPN
jgi:uncharacterized protein (TIGR03435 family)